MGTDDIIKPCNCLYNNRFAINHSPNTLREGERERERERERESHRGLIGSAFGPHITTT